MATPIANTVPLTGSAPLDVVTRSTDGQVSEWLMDGLTVPQGAVFSDVPNDWVIV